MHWDVADGNWLSGFVAGEGCFVLYTCSTKAGHNVSYWLSICLRRDDELALHEVQRILGGGTLRYRTRPNPNWSPQITWQWGGRKGAETIVPFFEQFPMRAKKQKDFEVWKAAVQLHSHFKRGNRSAWHENAELFSQIAKLDAQLKEGRKYTV